MFSLDLQIKDSISCYSKEKDDEVYENSSSSDEDDSPS